MPAPPQPGSAPYDVLVIGAGFSGLYALKKLRDDLGMRVRVFESGAGVGGTWYWNRYPGARCDSESFYYCFSFSDELAQEWEWSGKYPEQPEIERYLNHVADRFDLRRDIQLETRVAAARFDEAANRWELETEGGERFTAQFVISAVGCLSAANLPDIPGLEAFGGESFHTARWPKGGVDFSGKRVGLIGTGSTGIQATPVIARAARHLTVFQRTPNFTVPARHAPFAPEDQRRIKENYAEIFALARSTSGGFPYLPIEREATSVSPEEREAVFEELWEEGGFKFLWGGFNDILSDPVANEYASEFIRSKIRAMVDDPETAEKLCPYGYRYGAKRPPIDTDYYESFNRDNVRLVDLRSDGIERITAQGVRLASGPVDLDVLVFATGFDAMTGSLLKIDIEGLGGLRLQDAWREGPQTLLGLQIAGFPNLFTVTGPGSPSVLMNMPVAIEHHVEWIADCLQHMRDRGVARVEASQAAQAEWGAHVLEVAEDSFVGQGTSWYTGANIPGKARVVLPYTAGQVQYAEECDAIVADGYRGFVFGG
ncbi:MAG: NAD(P)/FAD-dependent oxidoreductase [Myxococcota bacterium]